MAKRGRKPYSQAKFEATQEVRRLYNKLQRRIKNIQQRYGDLPAVETFYNKGLQDFSTKGKTLEQLNNIRLDIEYVSSLKTSYAKGASNYQKYVSEWVDLYDKDREAYDKIMMLYNRLVEENELAEKFKYQVIEEIYTLIETRGELTPEELSYMIRQKFNEMYLNTRIEDLLGGSSYETGGKVR